MQLIGYNRFMMLNPERSKLTKHFKKKIFSKFNFIFTDVLPTEIRNYHTVIKVEVQNLKNCLILFGN